MKHPTNNPTGVVSTNGIKWANGDRPIVFPTNLLFEKGGGVWRRQGVEKH